MIYFIGNQNGMDHVDKIESTMPDVYTGAIEGEKRDRLYYITNRQTSTSYGKCYPKKLTWCGVNSIKGLFIRLLGNKLSL